MKRRLNLSRYKPKPEPTAQELADAAELRARAQAIADAEQEALDKMAADVIGSTHSLIKLPFLHVERHEERHHITMHGVGMTEQVLPIHYSYFADITVALPPDGEIVRILGCDDYMGTRHDIWRDGETLEQVSYLYHCDEMTYRRSPEGRRLEITRLQLALWDNRVPAIWAEIEHA